jgi:hypothetical protein
MSLRKYIVVKYYRHGPSELAGNQRSDAFFLRTIDAVKRYAESETVLPRRRPGVRRGIRGARAVPAERHADATAWPKSCVSENSDWAPAFAGEGRNKTRSSNQQA